MVSLITFGIFASGSGNFNSSHRNMSQFVAAAQTFPSFVTHGCRDAVKANKSPRWFWRPGPRLCAGPQPADIFGRGAKWL